MLPWPYGQMPEMARNSVDFPEPDGPASSALSPWDNASFSVSTMRVPSGSAMWTSSSAVPPPAAALRFGPMVPSTLAFSIASLNEVRRSTTDLNPASEL